MNKNMPLAAFLILTVGAAWADDFPGMGPVAPMPASRMRDLTEPQCPTEPVFGAPGTEAGASKDKINRDFTTMACSKKRSNMPSFMAPVPPSALDGGIDGGIVASDPVTRMKAQQAEAVAFSNQLAIQKRVGRMTNPWGDKPDAAASPNGASNLFSPHVTFQSEGFKKVPVNAPVKMPSRFEVDHKQVPEPSAAPVPASKPGLKDKVCEELPQFVKPKLTWCHPAGAQAQ